MLELSDEQLERLVSETIEPLASLPLPPDNAWGIAFDSFNDSLSPKEAWRLTNKGYGSRDETIWKSLPWLTDDRYTMWLFDEMAQASSYYSEWRLVTATLVYGRLTPKQRRRTIVLTWLMWKGKI